MVDIKELMQGGEYLNVKWLQNRDIMQRQFIIIDSGEVVDKFDKKKLELMIEFLGDKTQKLWNPNNESLVAFVQGTGSTKTEDWVGTIGNFSFQKAENGLTMAVAEFIGKK